MNRTTLALLILTAAGLAACGNEPKPAAPAAPAQPAAEAPAPAPAPAATAPPEEESAGNETIPAADVAVANITVGNSLDRDNRVVGGTAFRRSDTFYVDIETTGSGIVDLSARWTYQPDGRPMVVGENVLTIDVSGPATNQFQVTGGMGWQPGEYQVEVFVDDASAGTRRFTVN